ncbi:MAG TPA: hypothetical protein VM390_01655 [Acidimicrobiales bacterium]|nr:hypothetical protein [Acidimicrobiales bacterium]
MAAVVLVAGLAACGGGSGSEDRSSATTAPGRDAPTTVDTRFTGEGSAEFCRDILTYSERFRRLGEAASPDARTAYTEAARAVNASVGSAPPEIRRDVELVAGAFTDLVRELEAVDYQFPRLPPAVVTRFMSAELQSASTRVEAYIRTFCS